jgi:hypothetical protein
MKELENINGVADKLIHWEIFILAILAIILYYLKDSINEQVKSWKINKRKKNISNLKNHDFFLTVDNVYSEVRKINFNYSGEIDINKTKMLHHLILLKTSAITEKFTDFLNDKELNTCESQVLKFKVKTLLGEIVKKYTSEANKDFIKWGLDEKDSQYCINAYEDFRTEIVEAFVQRVDSICTNDDYFSNYDKMSAILEVVAISLYIIPKDVKNSFDKINGRFKSYKLQIS